MTTNEPLREALDVEAQIRHRIDGFFRPEMFNTVEHQDRADGVMAVLEPVIQILQKREHALHEIDTLARRFPHGWMIHSAEILALVKR